MAKDCPQKGKDVARPIRAIEDGVIAAIDAGALAGFFAVDHEGFQTVQHGKRRTPEPPGGVCGGLVLHTGEALRAEAPELDFGTSSLTPSSVMKNRGGFTSSLEVLFMGGIMELEHLEV